MSAHRFNVEEYDPEGYENAAAERAELELQRTEELPGYDRWKLISDLDARTDLPATEAEYYRQLAGDTTGCPQERWCSAVYDKLRAEGLTPAEAEDETLRRWRKGRAAR